MALFTVTTSTNSYGCQSPPRTFSITVNPLPQVATPTSLSVCDGTLLRPIVFSGSSVGGTTYRWTNDTPLIGLDTAGVGNLPGFVANNPYNVPVTASLRVTPWSNGCPGPAAKFSITVTRCEARPAAGRLAAGAVGEPGPGLQVEVGPNPTQQTLFIRIRGVQGQALQVRLVNPMGRDVHQQGIEQAGEEESLAWDLSQHPSGVYLLRVNSLTSQQSKTLKVIR
ncbi:hypothetical protein GCM10028809_59700 [Spirosoma gilvum]